MIGTVAILNVGEGDIRLSFDKDNKPERDRAAKIIKEMLAGGYAVMIEIGKEGEEPIYRRAKGFDAETNEYIIMGGPDQIVNLTAPMDDRPQQERRGGRPRKETRVPVGNARAVSVGRTAGGYDPNIPSRIQRGLKDVQGTLRVTL